MYEYVSNLGQYNGFSVVFQSSHETNRVFTCFPCAHDQVDHSIVETFVQGGRTVVTARVYPEHALDNAARVFLFNNGTELITATTVRAWTMSTVHITQFSG